MAGSTKQAEKGNGNYIKGYNFQVYIGRTRASFAKISGLEKTTESETFTEGGENSRVYFMSQRVAARSTVVLERGVLVNQKKAMQFKAGDFIQDGISIYLLDDSGKKCREYNLEGCIVQKITTSELDAQRSELMIERLEVSYESFSEE